MSSVPLVYPDQYPAGAKSVSGIELDTLPTRVANAVVAFDESIIPAAQLAAQAASDPRGSAAAAEAASDPRGAAAAAQAASDPLGAAAAVLHGVIVNSTPPVAGQVLEASSPTTASWTTPAGGQTVQVVTVNLTSAQLLALSTTPILLVPAPGAGKYIFALDYILEYTYGGTAYSSPLHTNNCMINWLGQTINSANFVMEFDWALAGGFIESTSSMLASGPCGNSPYSLAVATNNGLQFGAPNALTLGNGTLRVTLTYIVLST